MEGDETADAVGMQEEESYDDVRNQEEGTCADDQEDYDDDEGEVVGPEDGVPDREIQMNVTPKRRQLTVVTKKRKEQQTGGRETMTLGGGRGRRGRRGGRRR